MWKAEMYLFAGQRRSDLDRGGQVYWRPSYYMSGDDFRNKFMMSSVCTHAHNRARTVYSTSDTFTKSV